MYNIERYKTKRKQRIVKNPDVDIYNISVEPGYKYCNWIAIARQKLKERECKVMKRRICMIQTVINNEIDIFKNNIINTYAPNIFIDPCIYSNIMFKQYNLFQIYLNKLNCMLNQWTGVSLPHTKQELKTFKKYFSVARSWFDQRKKTILPKYLWISAFNLILSVCGTLSKSVTDPVAQTQFYKCLLFKISIKIFDAKWSCPASRPQELLSTSILKNSIVFQKYMTKYIHQSLCIECFLKGDKNIKIGHKLISDFVINNLYIVSKQTT
eukprot:59526_1